MIRSLSVMVLMAAAGLSCSACGDSSDPEPSPGSAGESGNAGGAGSASCPDVSGNWTIAAHCDASLIGLTLKVTETDCSLSFAPPFDVFSGSVTTDGKITLSGAQSCTGTATASSVSMSCTPAPCAVKLAR